MKLKYLFSVVFIILIYFFQINFLYASNNFLAFINLLFISILWLALTDSEWLWWFVMLSGLIMDMQFHVFGYYLLSYIILVFVVRILKNKIAVTGRLNQYFIIYSLSLISFTLLQIILRWLFNLMSVSWTILSFNSFSQVISFNIIQVYLVNLLILLFIYLLFKNKLSTV